MGWSWALFFCHSALTDVMVSAALRFNPALDREAACRQLVRDKSPAPSLGVRLPLLCPYVDNGNAICWDEEESAEYHSVLLAVLAERHFVVKDLVVRARVFDLVGVVFHGS